MLSKKRFTVSVWRVQGLSVCVCVCVCECVCVCGLLFHVWGCLVPYGLSLEVRCLCGLSRVVQEHPKVERRSRALKSCSYYTLMLLERAIQATKGICESAPEVFRVVPSITSGGPSSRFL